MRDGHLWAPGEVNVAGYVVEGGWFGAISADYPKVTGLLVSLGADRRVIYFDHRVKALRSVPVPT